MLPLGDGQWHDSMSGDLKNSLVNPTAVRIPNARWHVKGEHLARAVKSDAERPPSFAERFAYLRFLKHLELGKAPTWKEIGDAVGVTGEAVQGWVAKNQPPRDYKTVAELLRYFGGPELLEQGWLMEGVGVAPDPEMWVRWRSARGDEPAESIADRRPPVAKGFQSKAQRAAKKRRPGDRSA
jgi:transcriptional regulator with XRE-family HTH domain